MFKKTICFLILFITSICFSQKEKGFLICYEKYYNNNLIDSDNLILNFVTENKNYISSTKIEEKKAEFPYEVTLVNTRETSFQKINYLSAEKQIQTKDTATILSYKFELFPNETKKICGYTCKKATTVINSNQYTIWFTNTLKNNGGPTTLGQNLGLVLEVNRNNNFIITAKKVEKSKFDFPKTENIKSFDNLTYQDLVWKSRFKTLPIFTNEIINFSSESVSNDSILRFANGTIILKKVKFPKMSVKDLSFIDLSLQSNGDAYDRTGSLFVIPEEKEVSFFDALQKGISVLPVYENGNGKKYQGVTLTENYIPTLELMRFFTPFGIHKYNHITLKDKEWHDVVIYRQDISDFNNYLSDKEIWVGAFVGNYDKGGHKVSVNITIHNEGTKTKESEFILPLFNTTNIMEMAEQNYATMFDSENGLIVSFELKENVSNAKLRYISTGHGGWENGDEFLPKKNTIILDNKIVSEFIPWREDCGSYRLFNPASGNFNNGLSSSDYSRSNWCPGMVTYPTYIDLGNLSAGKHNIQIKIPQGKPEGESFSAWNISGVLIGN